MSDPVLQCRGLRREYAQGEERLLILQDVDLAVQAGERLAIVGASGSGKSTLLHLLGGLDQASAGEVWLDGERLDTLDEAATGAVTNGNLALGYPSHPMTHQPTAIANVPSQRNIRLSAPPAD